MWLKPFNIIATCPTGGLIETIPDAVSINQLKKQNPHIQSLRQYFIQTFKERHTQTTVNSGGAGIQKQAARYNAAKQNFLRSMAGYSLLCYIL